MKNIMRSQLYQILRSRNIRCVFIGFTILTILFTLIIHNNAGEMPLKASEVCTMLMSTIPMFVYLMSVILTSMICGDDLSDRAINYELSTGTSRQESFLGRSLTALIISTSASVIQFVIMIVTAVLISDGWGCEVSLGGLVQRILLLIPVFIRINAFIVMLTYIIKKPVAAIVLSEVMLSVTGMVSGDGAGVKYTGAVTGASCLTKVITFEQWYTFELNGEQHIICEPYLAASDAVIIVVVSLIAAAAYMCVGYEYFHKDDMR